jgi:putative Holliday junction resolvase
MDKRFLGVDLGEKRIGLAITDPLNIICQAYKTIYFQNFETLVKEFKSIIDEKNIGTIVFGLPMTLENKESKKTLEVKKIVEKLKSNLPEDLIIDFEDEALTSVEAHEIIRNMGKKPSKNKELIDQIAAQIILKSYKSRKGL